MHVNPPDQRILAILREPKTVAVVGCSPDATRDSHEIAQLLDRLGHRIVPINPSCTEILGQRCYGSLAEVPERIDMVDVFRRPEFVPEIVEEVIALGLPILWLQLGVIHEAAARKAQAAGIEVIMDRCPAIELRRLGWSAP